MSATSRFLAATCNDRKHAVANASRLSQSALDELGVVLRPALKRPRTRLSRRMCKRPRTFRQRVRGLGSIGVDFASCRPWLPREYGGVERAATPEGQARSRGSR